MLTFFFFFRKKKILRKIFFLQNIIILSKKVVWPQKSYPRYFRRYSKDLSQEFEKKINFCWFFMILAKKSIFYKYFGSMELICGFIEPWETDKLKKYFLKVKETLMQIFLDTLNNALPSKIDVIFLIENSSFGVPNGRVSCPRIIGSFKFQI